MINMSIKQPDRLSDPGRFFTQPSSPRQRQYEALRAFFVDKLPAADVARRFGYSKGSLHVLCHLFRQRRLPEFFATARKGPKSQPNRAAAATRSLPCASATTRSTTSAGLATGNRSAPPSVRS